MTQEILDNMIRNIEKWTCGNDYFPDNMRTPVFTDAVSLLESHKTCLEHGWPAVVKAASSLTEEDWINHKS